MNRIGSEMEMIKINLFSHSVRKQPTKKQMMILFILPTSDYLSKAQFLCQVTSGPAPEDALCPALFALLTTPPHLLSESSWQRPEHRDACPCERVPGWALGVERSPWRSAGRNVWVQ